MRELRWPKNIIDTMKPYDRAQLHSVLRSKMWPLLNLRNVTWCEWLEDKNGDWVFRYKTTDGPNVASPGKS
jgi:hypothetical protein